MNIQTQQGQTPSQGLKRTNLIRQWRLSAMTEDGELTEKLQRALINLTCVILSLIPFGVTKLYLKWPAWACLASVILFYIGMFAVVHREFPRRPLIYPFFIQHLARCVLLMLSPIVAMAVVFGIGLHLQNRHIIGAFPATVATVAIGAWLFYKVAVRVLPQAAVDTAFRLVRGRASPISLVNNKAARIKLPAADPGITWGGLKIPSKAATSHFMVVGTTGSGKTITLRLLMQEALRSIGTGADHRALIYDAKQDVVSQLAGMDLSCEIYTLNPFDDRGVAWDIAADVSDPATALQVASILIPPDKHSNQPFFVDAAQNLLYGVLLAFIRKGPKWRFADVVRAMQSPATIREILCSSSETQHIVERFWGNENTLANVMATVATKMTAYEPIAAMWEKAFLDGAKSSKSSPSPAGPRAGSPHAFSTNPQMISLTHWVKDNGPQNCILILGNNEKARKPLDAINQVIFRRVSELLLDEPNDPDDTRRSWVFLDEAAEAGRLDGLSSLLAKGRSKGTCVVLGFQDIEGLREVYGEKITNALTGQCNNKAFLRLESPPTAEWATKIFGSYEAIEQRRSDTTTSGYAPGGSSSSQSTTFAEQYVKREAVMESEFYLLPVTNPQNGLSGYYIVPEAGAYAHTYPGDKLFEEKLLMDSAEDIADLKPRKKGDQVLPRWDTEDFLRLGIPGLKNVVNQGPRAAGTTSAGTTGAGTAGAGATAAAGTNAASGGGSPAGGAASAPPGAAGGPAGARFTTSRNKPQT
jgi:type IV secretory pathway TraG/TraD family ATPase VirD4